MALDNEGRTSRLRFLEINKQAVDHALWQKPFLTEPRSAVLLTRNVIGNNAVCFLDGEKHRRRKHGIELVVLLFVELHIMRLNTPCKINLSGPAPRFL